MTVRSQPASSERDDLNVDVPLFVDLDGTLIKSDLLIESILLLIKQQPAAVFLLPLWLLRGKAYFKSRIAERVDIEPQLLPYSAGFLEYLRRQAASGRRLVLATASHQKFARAVSNHLGIFAQVLATDETTNLSAERKLTAIRLANGAGEFDYAGNSTADLEIWPHARQAIVVNPERGVERHAAENADVADTFRDRAGGLLPYLKAMRLHQWLKNLLLFVPFLTAHAWQQPGSIAAEVLGVLAFCLAASGVYLVNDLLDLPADRRHPRKCTRPFAAGDASLAHGAKLSVALFAAALVAAAAVSWEFVGVLLIYLATTFAYSLQLKKYLLIDVLLLAGLYTLRVIAGAVAIEVVVSFWLLAFSLFVFFSLALVKRCSELEAMLLQERSAAHGRAYQVSDLQYLHSMGTASGYVAVLVLALFINSPEVEQRYTLPQALWLLVPLVLYWISRLWLKAGRGEMHDDPLVFTVRDRGSRYVAVACVVVVLLAL